MAKKKGRAKSGTWFPRDLLLSSAFISLPKSAYPVFGVFMLKRDMSHNHECLNKNNISVTYKELEALGMSRTSITSGIDALLGRGFIKIVRPGGAYQQDKTIYGLTGEWRFWQQGDDPIRVRQKGKKAGYGALEKYHGRIDE